MMLRSCGSCFGRFGLECGGGSDELLWQLDLKGHASGEFSIAVVQANSSLEDQGQVLTSPFGTYVGIYDGHGGPDASRFVNTRLFPHLNRLAFEQGRVTEEVIRRAFGATEEEFMHAARKVWTAKPQIASVGTCCLVGVISGDDLHVANLGDSRVVLGRRSDTGRVVAERLSTDHNVSDEAVRNELKDLHPDDSHIVVYTQGVWRIKGIIQVSRSIGDMYLKKPDVTGDPMFQRFVSPVPIKRSVISSEPSIRNRKLRPQDLFLIFASDGLWEQLSDEAAVEIVIKSPRSGIAKRLVKAALQEVARKREMRYSDVKRLEKGVRRHFHDDITVIVIYLDHHGARSQRYRDGQLDYTNAPVDIFSLNSNAPSSNLQLT